MTANNGIENPNESLCIPSWISVDYFKDILAKDEPHHSSVKNFQIVAAIPPGENFTSVMLRIHMDLDMQDGTNKHKTYILKTMLDEDKGGAIINNLSLFPKEMEMYGKYLPAYEELYKQAGLNIQLAPRCLLTERRDGRMNFVFEDLANRNFTNLDRLQGCDMTHMTAIMKKLAEFHAVSAVYEEKNGPYPEDFQRGFVDERTGFEFQEEAYHTKVNAYKKCMLEWGMENAEEYVEKYPTFDQYWKSCLATLQQSSNKFNVLTHGDFWSSNIMFSYTSEKTLKDLLIVDYQICKWGSPAEDLIFFITLSAAKDIKIKEFDHFVAIYHKHLVKCLKALGYKKDLPKLRDLQMDMYDKKQTFYAFFACTNHLIAICLPSDKDTNIHSFSRKDEIGAQFRMRALQNPLFVENVRELFPFFHNRGVFNFNDFDED